MKEREKKVVKALLRKENKMMEGKEGGKKVVKLRMREWKNERKSCLGVVAR